MEDPDELDRMGSVIIKCMPRYMTAQSVEWIDLAQDRDKWRAAVNTVMNLWDSIKCREFNDWLRNC